MSGLETRLLEKVEENSETGCWCRNFFLDKDGYSQMGVGGRREFAHRVAYRLYRGIIPEGLFVCHTCDNRKCINPDHLWLGTAKDNATDMARKGRGSKVGNRGNVRGDLNGSRTCPEKYRGEANWKAILTDDIAREILRLKRNGKRRKEVSQVLGLNLSTVDNVWYGRSWKHIT